AGGGGGTRGGGRKRRTSPRAGGGGGGGGRVWPRHSRSVCPDRISLATRQTTSGCSPGFETNSKSTNHTCSNGNSVGVTSSPLLEEFVLWAVDQSAFVAEGETKNLRLLEFRPDRVGIASGRRRKHLVDLVLLVGVEPHPLV